MKNLKTLFICLVGFALISGCSDEKNGGFHEEVISVDNEYLKVEIRGTNFVGHIKKPVSEIVLIKKDGSFSLRKKLGDVSHADTRANIFLLLPSDHQFVQQFNVNPFQGELPFAVTRPSFWGKKLKHNKTEKQTSLFQIEGELSDLPPTPISSQKLFSLFGDYKANLLGKGGVGEVFKINYNGKEFGLKRKATEASIMEKLQFTEAVARVFAVFLFENEPFMIMELGTATLENLNKRGEKLKATQVVDAVNRFKNLIAAQKVLNIENRDIKPQNFILTQEGKLVVIDISASSTPGFYGTSGELLARALLENQLGQSLRAGDIPLQEFFRNNAALRDGRIASPKLFISWNKQTCKQLLPGNAACHAVANFDDLFSLLPKTKRYELAQLINDDQKNNSGTHDRAFRSTEHEFGYDTNLLLPNVQDLKDDVWDAYFAKRDKVGDLFCAFVEHAESIGEQMPFFIPLKAKYFATFCQVGTAADPLRFIKVFTDSHDPAFREWIEDALAPSVKLNFFEYLAKSTNGINDNIFREIIREDLGRVDQNLSKVVLDLYQLK